MSSTGTLKWRLRLSLLKGIVGIITYNEKSWLPPMVSLTFIAPV
jgi:hypothetical protein